MPKNQPFTDAKSSVLKPSPLCIPFQVNHRSTFSDAFKSVPLKVNRDEHETTFEIRIKVPKSQVAINYVNDLAKQLQDSIIACGLDISYHSKYTGWKL